MKSVSMGEAITGMGHGKSKINDEKTPVSTNLGEKTSFIPSFFLGVLKVLSLSFFYKFHPQFWQN
jgi:hypothetical protein